MKFRFLISLLLLTAFFVPAAISAAAPDTTVVVAKKKKKKLSYCAKQAQKKKAKAKASVKSAKFFLYTKKRPDEYFFCSEAPKFSGSIAAWAGIKTTSHLRAVKNNCAVFFSETKQGPGYDDGAKYLKVVSAKYFRKGSKLAKQTHASRLGDKTETVSLQEVALSKNCVYAAAFKLNGVSTLVISGAGDFGYTGRVERSIPAASDAELKNVKVVATSATSAQVQWTEGGAPKTYDYVVK